MSGEVPLSCVKQLRVIESNLHVEINDGATQLRIVARGEDAMFSVRMPTAVWREFCRRQISVPPPLPKGDQ